jgi:hypothetical protein
VRHPRIVLCVALSALLAFVPGAVAAPQAATTEPCGTIVGPSTHVPTGLTRTYVVEGVRVACSFAKTWAERILHEQTRSGGLFPHPTGPPHWQCTASTLVKQITVDGFCGMRGTIRSFFWAPQGAEG